MVDLTGYREGYADALRWLLAQTIDDDLRAEVEGILDASDDVGTSEDVKTSRSGEADRV